MDDNKYNKYVGITWDEDLKIAWILLLRCKGMSYREIAKQVEMSAASIQRILEKYGDLLRNTSDLLEKIRNRRFEIRSRSRKQQSLQPQSP
jgi:transposase